MTKTPKPKYYGVDSEVVGDEKRKACYAAWTIHRDSCESVGDVADLCDFRAGFLYGAEFGETYKRMSESEGVQ